MKKAFWIITLMIILGCFVAYKVYDGPLWIGMSKDGKWEATLHKAHEGSAMVYDGELKWEGPKAKVFVTSSQYIVNGKLRAGDKNKEVMPPVSQLEFVMGTSKPKKNDKVKVDFYWTEDGKRFEDTIILKRKYF